MGLVTRSWPTVSKRPPTCVPPLGCGGRVELLGAEPDALLPVTELLERSGCILRPTERGLLLQSDGRLHTPGPVVTRPHPGFPTDAQAPMMAALLRAAGITEFTETIFENRLRHVEQLRLLGADIRQYGSRALVRGVAHLHGGIPGGHRSALRRGAAHWCAAGGKGTAPFWASTISGGAMTTLLKR